MSCSTRHLSPCIQRQWYARVALAGKDFLVTDTDDTACSCYSVLLETLILGKSGTRVFGSSWQRGACTFPVLRGGFRRCGTPASRYKKSNLANTYIQGSSGRSPGLLLTPRPYTQRYTLPAWNATQITAASLGLEDGSGGPGGRSAASVSDAALLGLGFGLLGPDGSDPDFASPAWQEALSSFDVESFEGGCTWCIQLLHGSVCCTLPVC